MAQQCPVSVFDLQEAASLPCTVATATRSARLLRAGWGEEEVVEKAGWLFWRKKPICRFPRKPSWEKKNGGDTWGPDREREGRDPETSESRSPRGCAFLSQWWGPITRWRLRSSGSWWGIRAGAPVQEAGRPGLRSAGVLGGLYQPQQAFFLAGRST